ncbi:MAG TPA: metalloregulator ArsR/SmtB family transcription factor [Chryseosolibacter sp.]
MRRDVFQAIADPTRRDIITMLARKSMNLNSVAEQFGISRPAISKQVKILVECGLITIREEGRERICEARLEKLDEVYEWVDKYRKIWASRLDSLDNYITALQANAKTKIKKHKRK